LDVFKLVLVGILAPATDVLVLAAVMLVELELDLFVELLLYVDLLVELEEFELLLLLNTGLELLLEIFVVALLVPLIALVSFETFELSVVISF
jgi:hypothetical protein